MNFSYYPYTTHQNYAYHNHYHQPVELSPYSNSNRSNTPNGNEHAIKYSKSHKALPSLQLKTKEKHAERSPNESPFVTRYSVPKLPQLQSKPVQTQINNVTFGLDEARLNTSLSAVNLNHPVGRKGNLCNMA